MLHKDWDNFDYWLCGAINVLLEHKSDSKLADFLVDHLQSTRQIVLLNRDKGDEHGFEV